MSTDVRSTAPVDLAHAEAAELSAQYLVLDHTAAGVQDLVARLTRVQQELPARSERPTVSSTYEILELLTAASQSVAESLEVLADELGTAEVRPS